MLFAGPVRLKLTCNALSVTRSPRWGGWGDWFLQRGGSHPCCMRPLVWLLTKPNYSLLPLPCSTRCTFSVKCGPASGVKRVPNITVEDCPNSSSAALTTPSCWVRYQFASVPSPGVSALWSAEQCNNSQSLSFQRNEATQESDLIKSP